MRYPESRKEETRRHILEQGAYLLKKYGFAATGVDKLMQAVGLSGAALYAHFPSKMALLEAVVQAEMERSLKMLTGRPEDAPAEALQRCLDTYLTLEHVRHPEYGCILPALAAELGRAGVEVQELIAAAEQRFVDFWAGKLGSRASALVLLSQCVGAILMARMSEDSTQQQAILAASRSSLLALLPAAPSGL